MKSARLKVRWKNHIGICGAAISAAQSRRDACTTSCFSRVPKDARALFPVALLLLAVAGGRVSRADWPMYRSDAGRTGYTTESLPARLSERWVHRSHCSPTPAWPRSDRMIFDHAYQPIIFDGMAIYGSSADGIIYALDVETGDVRWTFQTDGPIRFTPAAWQGRVLVVSDDGYLYALSGKDGQLLWKRRGGPDHGCVLGNERLISKWPARGGPVIFDDIVYFAAGIWPSDGIYIYALDPATGEVMWRNDDSGDITMPQPHGGANANSGVSAQGHLVATQDHLFLPTGRAVPAVFHRDTGEFSYFHLQRFGQNGGTSTLAADGAFFNGGLAFNSNDGNLLAKIGPGQLAATPDGLILAAGTTLARHRWEEVEQTDRRGGPVTSRSLARDWSIDVTAGVNTLIVAADKIICGGDGRVVIVDANARHVLTSVEVTGTVLGLAAAEGKLLASTDRGVIHCFADPALSTATDAQDTPAIDAVTNEDLLAAQAAEEIIRRTGITEGLCLDLGSGDGAVACELARRTHLRVFAIDADPTMVRAARQRLKAAGLDGHRVTVQCRDVDSTGYPQYFANLIISGRSVRQGTETIAWKEVQRLQRPYGGMVCVGRLGEMTVHKRAALAGAGSWTHQYADAANTLTSDDMLIEGRLSMLWFRDVAFDVPQRHGRAPASLYDKGRLFHEGLHGVVAIDAYNGRELWRYEIPGLLTAYDGDELMGVAGTAGSSCVEGNSLYVRHKDRCLRLDTGTGKLLGEFPTPVGPDGKRHAWGYIACVNGLLYGTVANEEHIVTYRYQKTTGDMSRLLTESQVLFALDAQSGNLRWQYQARDSIRHNAITIGNGKVFLIDRPLALFDREKRPQSKQQATGRLMALDAKTGEKLWEEQEDIYGTLLALSEKHAVLLMSYQPTRFRLDSEIGGRMTAFGTQDGQKLWDVTANYESRPLVNDDIVYAQGGSWHLLSGEPRPFNFKRSYGCGILAASRRLLVFRSATLGYFDFAENQGIKNYGGIRPGCWVNVLPAGGLVLAPDTTAGCRCSYLNRAWIALVPTGK